MVKGIKTALAHCNTKMLPNTASNTNDRLRMLSGILGKGSSGPVGVCTGTARGASVGSIACVLLELVFSGVEGVKGVKLVFYLSFQD